MAIITNVSFSGQRGFSSFNGAIQLDQARARLIVYDETTGDPLSIVNNTGFHVYNQGNELTTVDNLGLRTYNPSGGEVVRSGKLPDDTYGLTAAEQGETLDTIYG